MDLQLESMRDHESRDGQMILIGSGSFSLGIRGRNSLRPGPHSFPFGLGTERILNAEKFPCSEATIA